jgi:hypothetical protein
VKSGGALVKIQQYDSSKCEELGFEHVFGDVGSDDLVFHFAVFEEQEKWDGFHIVFHREATGVVHIDFGDFCLSFDFSRELFENGTDHFARSAPFGPEIDKDREIGIDHFGLETIFGKVECHPEKLEPDSEFVKGAERKNLGERCSQGAAQ